MSRLRPHKAADSLRPIKAFEITLLNFLPVQLVERAGWREIIGDHPVPWISYAGKLCKDRETALHLQGAARYSASVECFLIL